MALAIDPRKGKLAPVGLVPRLRFSLAFEPSEMAFPL